MTTENNSSLSLKKAGLESILNYSTAQVTFTKKDGSERVMKCTLLPDVIEPYERKTEGPARNISEDVLPVWDLEAKAWRSITVSSVKSVDVVIGA